ncbi:MAG: hypothetical protein RL497_1396 [Pseudomonadota bacterium]
MFESKTQINGDGWQCVDIEGKAFLWTPQGGTTSNRLIITAHGHRKTASMFRLKRGGINFYSVDGNSVNDPGLRNFYEGNAVPVETLNNGNQCYNYILTKYTNSERTTNHNELGESYNGVNALMNKTYGGFSEATLNGLPEFERNQAVRQNNFVKPSILTIRNLHFKSNVNLEWVLNNVGHRFGVIECLFCRNTLITAALSSISAARFPYSNDVPIT